MYAYVCDFFRFIDRVRDQIRRRFEAERNAYVGHKCVSNCISKQVRAFPNGYVGKVHVLNTRTLTDSTE